MWKSCDHMNVKIFKLYSKKPDGKRDRLEGRRSDKNLEQSGRQARDGMRPNYSDGCKSGR